MKKTAALLLCVTLAAGALTACGGNKTETAKTEDKKTQDTKEETTDEGGAKTGLSVITSLAKSTPASEEDGLAQTDSTVVAVLVDADGKILDCKIDAAQTQISFSKEGKLVGSSIEKSLIKRASLYLIQQLNLNPNRNWELTMV